MNKKKQISASEVHTQKHCKKKRHNRPRARPETPDPITEYEKVGPLIEIYILHSESGPYLPILKTYDILRAKLTSEHEKRASIYTYIRTNWPTSEEMWFNICFTSKIKHKVILCTVSRRLDVILKIMLMSDISVSNLLFHDLRNTDFWKQSIRPHGYWTRPKKKTKESRPKEEDLQSSMTHHSIANPSSLFEKNQSVKKHKVSLTKLH